MFIPESRVIAWLFIFIGIPNSFFAFLSLLDAVFGTMEYLWRIQACSDLHCFDTIVCILSYSYWRYVQYFWSFLLYLEIIAWLFIFVWIPNSFLAFSSLLDAVFGTKEYLWRIQACNDVFKRLLCVLFPQFTYLCTKVKNVNFS